MIFVYLKLALIVFMINLVPVFMPPTWLVLSFAYIRFNLLLTPTVLIGVCAATLGRIALALIARKWLKNIVTKKFFTNYKDLGVLLEKNQHLTIPVILTYAFTPVSSNALFIMAGLSGINLKIIASSFFVGRFCSYTFWITVSHQLSDRLEDIFAGQFRSANAVISAIVGLVFIYIIGKIKWSVFLAPKKSNQLNKRSLKQS